MNKLPLLLLSGCLVEHSDLDADATARCRTELSILEDSCSQADVIGSHSQTALIKAVRGLTDCVGRDVRAVCSDPGIGEPKVLSVQLKDPLK